jgi:hypothetical protein
MVKKKKIIITKKTKNFNELNFFKVKNIKINENWFYIKKS